MAGNLAAIGTLGSAGALAADAIAHDPMDRAAQGYKDLVGGFEGADQLTQQIFSGVFAQGQMSMKDRMLATGILSGELPPGAVERAKEVADTPAGKAGIELAGKVVMNRPELAPAVAELANQEIALFAQEKEMGATPADVMTAADEGAGVSPVPALLGGAGVGGGVALLGSLLGRRGRDPFKVPRGAS